MNINFGSLADNKPVSAIKYLKPYNIYDNVTIESCNITSGVGKTSGKEWKSLNIVFSCPEGIYRDSIFYLDENNPKDWERQEYDQPNGGKRVAASSWEEVKNKMAAIGFAFFPKTYEKIQAASGKVKSFEELMNLFKAGIDKNLGKNPTHMKLVGRNKDGNVYATLPKFTGIAQAKDQKTADNNGVKLNEWYTWATSPFGDNLTFTNYEMSQMSSLNKAKPSVMPNTGSEDLAPTTADDADVNYDDLIASL